MMSCICKCMALVALVPATLLIACSSSTDNASSDQPLSRIAVVIMEQSSRGPVSSLPEISVSTASLNIPKTIDQLLTQTIRSFRQTPNFCGSLADLDFNFGDPFGAGEFERIGAGDVVTIQSNGNTYAEASQDFVGDYLWTATESGELPDNLVMDIPGGAFPAISAWQLPELDALVVTEQQQYLEGDTLSWNASTLSNLPVWITFNDNELICITDDDGEFEIPNIVEAITSVMIQRRRVEVIKQNDAALLALHTMAWES